MRIAIFSDVHGNPYACEAVLRTIAANRPFDRVIAAGDLALGGSDPARCLDLLMDSKVEAIFGNTDEYICRPENTPGDPGHLKKWDEIITDVEWVRTTISSAQLEWLCSIPFDLTISPTSAAADDLLVVHAQPKSIEGILYPPEEEQIKLIGEIWQPDDDPGLAEMLEGVTAKHVAFGHFHYSSVRKWRGYTLVNVAPCSQPAKDFDPRARFTIFEWANDAWSIERKYIEYDWRIEVSALRTCGLPGWRFYARSFPPLA